jgi:hypothetical protein
MSANGLRGIKQLGRHLENLRTKTLDTIRSKMTMPQSRRALDFDLNEPTNYLRLRVKLRVNL